MMKGAGVRLLCGVKSNQDSSWKERDVFSLNWKERVPQQRDDSEECSCWMPV